MTTKKSSKSTTTSKAKQPIVDVSAVLSSIASERENWEASAYKTSNQMLYGILQRCYELDGKLTLPSEHIKLNDYCLERGIRSPKGTKTIAKIVKCVFPIDRRRVCTYVNALRAAKQQHVNAAEVATWLEDNGGVTQIGLKRSDEHKTLGERAAFAHSVVFSGKPLATVSRAALDRQYDDRYESQDNVDAVVLLAQRNNDGTYGIYKLVQSKGVVNAALSSCYTKAEQTHQQQTVIGAAAKRQEVQVRVLTNRNYKEAA
ncbi:MAG TPA: hypothetical protein VMW15_06100 [Terracidiphilus sp.]|nr:hypothetical protein [Terracidiphilus sp.]